MTLPPGRIEWRPSAGRT